jgi:TRAF3-interacting protein 1
MTEDIKPEVVKKTQELLSKYIKKPPLTDRLLKKPPFRFLHDIVTSVSKILFSRISILIYVNHLFKNSTFIVSTIEQVIKETGFLEGLFSPEELIADNVKDRDGKIAFLEKLIGGISKCRLFLFRSARFSKIWIPFIVLILQKLLLGLK